MSDETEQRVRGEDFGSEEEADAESYLEDNSSDLMDRLRELEVSTHSAHEVRGETGSWMTRFPAVSGGELCSAVGQRESERSLREVFGRGGLLSWRRGGGGGLVLWSGVTCPLLSPQVANHVVQALLNQKVSVRFCWLAPRR